MKIFRWLFSNLFLIFLVVAVIYSYMFWGNLTGKDTPAGKAIAYLSTEFVEVEEFIAAIKEKQQTMKTERDDSGSESTASLSTNVVAAAPVADPVPAPVATNIGKTDETVTKQEDKSSAPVAEEEKEQQLVQQQLVQQPPVSISYSQNQRRIKQNSAGVLEKQEIEPKVAAIVSKPASSVPELAVAEVDKAPIAEAPIIKVPAANAKFVSAEVEKQLNNVDDKGQIIDATRQSSSVRNTWITARRAFHHRDYSLSEKSYKSVIDITDDNFDAYGELGNVYFNQGKNEQAAAAYLEAASILVKKGQVNRARSLTGLLRHLDKSKAEELQKLIESTQAERKS